MPGDRVDIVLIQMFPAQGPQSNGAGHMTSGETALHNLRVIAIDQIMNSSVRPLNEHSSTFGWQSAEDHHA